STTFQEPSTDIGYKKKKRLAKSGKDNTNGLDYHYIAFTHCLHRNVTAVTPHCNVLYAVL
ncbi:hypothetical protein, partial [Bacteroides uniformis]|uniref:hypothetical protein n=1 Tax=Bacteroides uniformis TaxID=820 RepID=UPI001BB206D9